MRRMKEKVADKIQGMLIEYSGIMPNRNHYEVTDTTPGQEAFRVVTTDAGSMLRVRFGYKTGDVVTVEQLRKDIEDKKPKPYTRPA